jgi:hypothetical protein
MQHYCLDFVQGSGKPRVYSVPMTWSSMSLWHMRQLSTQHCFHLLPETLPVGVSILS